MSDSYVTSTITMPGFHRWPGATPHRDYLGSSHRHLFWIDMSVYVGHDDRDVEFHDLGDWMREVLKQHYPAAPVTGLDFGASSCESIARVLVEEGLRFGYRVRAVTVSEDREFSATVETP